MTIPLVLSAVTLVLAALLHDFGRRWLARQDYSRALEKIRVQITELETAIDANKTRGDKALSSLTTQTQEALNIIEKKQTALLSGQMMRTPNSRRIV